MWEPIRNAPFGIDLELAVIEGKEPPHALMFPCRRVLRGWVRAGSIELVTVHPTHWRMWSQAT